MDYSTQEQLCFHPVDGQTVRGSFDGGALSSDLGPLLVRGIDREIGLTERLANAFKDQRHPSYVTYSVKALFTQRIFQVASTYEDGNDANALHADPVFKLGLDRKPLDAAADLASAPTFSRLEKAAPSRDRWRLAHAFVDQFIARYRKPPQAIVLDMDHSEDPRAWAAGMDCLPSPLRPPLLPALVYFRGLVRPVHHDRPASRQTADRRGDAANLKRVLQRLRAAWPNTPFILRGDGHFANPELMQLALDTPYTDFIFGLAGNAVLSPLAKPFLLAARQRHETRCAFARHNRRREPDVLRTYHELDYAAKT